MRHLGILKSVRLVDLLNWIGIPVALAYVVSMFIVPWVEGHGSWAYLQNVWERWQSLNVGMLALISSITAFNISRFNANNQREREFAASKAFLPAALSELVVHFKESAVVFQLGWEAQAGVPPDFGSSTLPQGYKDVFTNCIRHAEPEVGEYLSRILIRMQIHDARLRDYIGEENPERRFRPKRSNLISYFYRVAELQALVGKLFPFARGRRPFDSSALDSKDFGNAYVNLDVEADEFETNATGTLTAFTQSALAGNASQNT